MCTVLICHWPIVNVLLCCCFLMWNIHKNREYYCYYYCFVAALSCYVEWYVGYDLICYYDQTNKNTYNRSTHCIYLQVCSIFLLIEFLDQVHNVLQYMCWLWEAWYRMELAEMKYLYFQIFTTTSCIIPMRRMICMHSFCIAHYEPAQNYLKQHCSKCSSFY